MIYLGLYQRDFGMINRTHICLTVVRNFVTRIGNRALRISFKPPLVDLLQELDLPASLSCVVCVIVARSIDKHILVVNSG